jgi:RHS repeat-associated protein
MDTRRLGLLAVITVCVAVGLGSAPQPRSHAVTYGEAYDQFATTTTFLTTTASTLDPAWSRGVTTTLGAAVSTTSTTLTTLVCGDPVDDERIAATDALYVLMAAVGTRQCEACVCDVDLSGAVRATDALRVLRYAVGIPVALTCPACGVPPMCGDDVVNQLGEECDGADDGACPGLCDDECRCAEPVCGDDRINDAGEECDGSDAAACPGLCRQNCTCPPAICGNGVLEQAEICEGDDLRDQTCNSLGFAGGTLACATTCNGFDSRGCELSETLPPDPTTVASTIDPTVTTDVGTSTRFLYTGSNRVQYGVGEGTIAGSRAAVLRGLVKLRDGTGLAGVEVRILGHAELGATQSRADGRFDMAVNGGGLLTVDYRKAGYLPAQRQVEVPWQDYVEVPDVVLVALDSRVTTVDLSTGEPIEVARGTEVDDAAGTRQSTLLFARGTQAELVMADGSRQPVTTIDVRATEYTVGDSGPEAMPAELPPNSGYTYAVELSVDEAISAGATDVQFSEPVAYYVENFLDAEVGTAVPVGYYDRARGAWVASDSGRVIEIVSITAGLADLDTDGDGAADDEAILGVLGITEAERERLATLYTAGQSLWRVAVSHFSPWDCNWGFGPPDDAEFPDQSDPDSGNETGNGCNAAGSVIGCQNQVLGESIDLVGVPFGLNYSTDRASGRRANVLDISLSGPTVPASLVGIELEIDIAGQHHVHSLSRDHQCLSQRPTLAPGGTTSGIVVEGSTDPGRAPVPDLTNQSYVFTWDGEDAYGRTIQGKRPITVRIGYVYCGVYQSTSRFGYNGDSITGSRSRQEIVLRQVWEGEFGRWDARAQGLGGWTLDVHHSYDPWSRTLYLGSGVTRDVRSLSNVIKTVAGVTDYSGVPGEGVPATRASLAPTALDTLPNGGFYVAEAYRVRYVTPDGLIWTVAGTGIKGYSGDGGPATEARLGNVSGVAQGPDGSLYMTTWDRTPGSPDEYSNRVRRVTPDGIIDTVAGGAGRDYSGDGGPAAEALFWDLAGVDVGADGSVYLVDEKGHGVRRIAPDGIITTLAGRGYCEIYNQQYCLPGFAGDGGPAEEALLDTPTDVATSPDGSVYIADSYNNRIRRVGPDGTITTVAGNGTMGWDGDGAPATDAQLYRPQAIAVSADGTLYIAVRRKVRRVKPDGIIETVTGHATATGYSPDGTPAADALLYPPSGLAVGPDGLYIAMQKLVRRIEPAIRGLGIGTGNYVASEDGREIYVFDEEGRHLTTADAFTGSLLYGFGYDAAGHVTSIQDHYGNVTTIERNASNEVTAVVGPYGQRTDVSLDSGGYLAALAHPGGETTAFEYATGGLLTTLTDANGNAYEFAYDEEGRLVRDDDPGGGFQTLEAGDVSTGFEVVRTTALGRATTYRVEKLSTGEERVVTTLPSGAEVETLVGPGGARTKTSPDGTVATWVLGPDSRFGMHAPNVASLEATTPGGLTLQLDAYQSVTLSDLDDLLSVQTKTDTFYVNGRAYAREFNAQTGRLTFTTPTGRRAVTSLDETGRVISRQLGNFSPVTYGYDARGKLASLSRGSGADERTITFGYDAQGRLATIEDPLLRSTAFEHDAAGRLIKLTLPDGGEIHYAYDAVGNLTSITPPGRPAHLFTYTALNLGETYVAPDVGAGAGTTTRGYDLDRQVAQVTRPDDDGIDLAYDGAGRLSTVTLPRGIISYDYHADTSTLVSITAPEIVVSYGFDGFLPTQARWSGSVTGSVDISYDDDFRVMSRSVNGSHAVAFGYDSDGLLTAAGALTLTRDGQNGVVTATGIGNVVDTRDYDSFGEIRTYAASYDGVEIFAAQYSTDKLGRIVEKVETVGGTTDTYAYGYDEAGRLIEVDKNGTPLATYGYDGNGNRISEMVGDGLTIGICDDQDRLLEYGTTSYTYTANGELLTRTTGMQTTTFDYDVLGNLMAVDLPDGTAIAYLVDGRGRRVGKKVNGVLTQGFLYKDRLEPIAELDGSGAVVARFVYADAANVPAYVEKGGNTYRIVSDHLGSPRMVVDVATGTVVQQLDYDAFGNVVVDTNPGFQPFGFAGGLYDADTGLVRFGHRDYDAETGRWTAKDPLAFRAGDTNLYGYLFNDPINSADPSGLAYCGLRTIVGPALTGSTGSSGMGLLPLSAIFGGGGAGIVAMAAATSAVIGSGIAGYLYGTCLMHFTEAVTGYDPADVLCDLLNCDDPCGIQSPFI